MDWVYSIRKILLYQDKGRTGMVSDGVVGLEA